MVRPRLAFSEFRYARESLGNAHTSTGKKGMRGGTARSCWLMVGRHGDLGDGQDCGLASVAGIAGTDTKIRPGPPARPFFLLSNFTFGSGERYQPCPPACPFFCVLFNVTLSCGSEAVVCAGFDAAGRGLAALV